MNPVAEPTLRTAQAARQLWRLWRKGAPPHLGTFIAEHAPLTDEQFVEVVQVDQRERWLLGERIPTEEYFPLRADLERTGEHILELVLNEMLLREDLGEKPTLSEYEARFPDLAERLRDQITLRRTIPSPRLATGNSPDLDSPFLELGGHQPRTRRGSERWPEVVGYEILSVLGRGGMGVVYLAQQTHLKREVALKMLPGEFQADGEHFRRFRTEAESIAKAQHPHIVQIYEVGELQGRPFLALEYVDGGSLAKRLRGGPVAPRQAAQWIETLALTMHFAHQRGIIHRDLKPANVLLTKEGEPKIADFGLAKQLGTECDANGRFPTQEGTVVGTPEYMSPEQVAGAVATAAVDTYALGIILYELLTARVPYRAASPVETMVLVRTQEPVSPRRLQPGLARDLETITLKCLEKEPSKRYASAAALAEDLRRFLEDRTIQARRAGNTERIVRWCRRNPLPAASLAAVVGIFFLAFFIVTMSYLRAETARQDEAWQRGQAQLREKAERWERYRANIVASSAALQAFNVGSARRTLEAAPEEYRNWEWRHFHSRLNLAQHVFESPDPPHEAGNLVFAHGRLVVLGNNHSLQVWDQLDQPGHRAIDTAGNEPGEMRLSPDGRTFARARATGEILLVDVASGAVRHTLLGHREPVNALLFSGDSRRLVSVAGEPIVHVWNAEAGTLDRSFSLGYSSPGHTNLSGDGRRLAISRAPWVELDVWDLDSGTKLSTLTGLPGLLHITSLDLRGERVLTVDPFPMNTLRLWDGHTGRLLREMHAHGNAVTQALFSPDGARLATGSRDQTVRLWEGTTGQPIATLKDHRGWVSHLAFSPDSTRLLSSSQDHTIRLWDAANGEALGVLPGHTDEVGRVAYSADGQTIVSASKDMTIRLWDVRAAETNGVFRGHSKYVYAVAVHPDGQRVASAGWDGTARVWEQTSGRELASLAHGEGAIVSSVAFHPAGDLLATRARDGIRLWDLASGKETHFWATPLDWRDTRLAFSANGDRLASGCKTCEIRIWDVATRSELMVLRGHKDEVRDVAFSPDGRWLASVGDALDRDVYVWDLEKRELRLTLKGHTLNPYAVAFNANGTLLASAGLDGVARLWNTATWQEVAAFRHGSNVYGVAFTPDGTRLACACADNSIRLWGTWSHQEVAELRGHGSYVHHVAFSPDGTRLISASGDFTARVWDTIRPQDRARPATTSPSPDR